MSTMCVELMFLASSVRSMFPIIISSGVEIFQSRSLSEVLQMLSDLLARKELIEVSLYSFLFGHV